MVMTAGYSGNTVISSAHDLAAIARGEADSVGEFNILKSGFENAGELVSDGIEGIASLVGQDIEISVGGEFVGGMIFEGTDLVFNAYGVGKGTQKIMSKGYRFMPVTNTEVTLIGNDYVFASEKVGAGVEIVHTLSNWAKRIYDRLVGE